MHAYMRSVDAIVAADGDELADRIDVLIAQLPCMTLMIHAYCCENYTDKLYDLI
jgi:hypothetical protein